MPPCRTLWHTRTLLLGALIAAGSSGCGSDTLTLKPAFIASSTDLVDFGDVFLGTSETRTISLINEGEKALTLGDSGGDILGGIFVVEIADSTIAANAEAIVDIAFAPNRVDDFETDFTIPNDSINDSFLVVTLRGHGVSSDPCAGVTCDNPPASACLTSTTSRHYVPTGTCEDGDCTYESIDETCGQWGCNFSTGLCGTDPCLGVSCVTPPASACLTNDTSRHFSPAGTCDAGGCTYESFDETCDFGCDFPSGLCTGDPCQGVACQTPPNSCFLAQGNCVGGACQYNSNDGAACSDGDPCTDGDACSSGACRGTTRVCNAAPAATCTNPSTLRTYQPLGTCDGTGTCGYDHLDVTCEFGCSGGGCSGDPCAGGCNDGNPCTADACDYGVGCTHTPQAGTCVSGSGDCPTGECNGGTCLPKAGVICQAEYDVDLCQTATISGVCTGAGQCVVSSVPPDYTCPGCNGICLECYIIQVCIPLF